MENLKKNVLLFCFVHHIDDLISLGTDHNFFGQNSNFRRLPGIDAFKGEKIRCILWATFLEKAKFLLKTCFCEDYL